MTGGWTGSSSPTQSAAGAAAGSISKPHGRASMRASRHEGVGRGDRLGRRRLVDGPHPRVLQRLGVELGQLLGVLARRGPGSFSVLRATALNSGPSSHGARRASTNTVLMLPLTSFERVLLAERDDPADERQPGDPPAAERR